MADSRQFTLIGNFQDGITPSLERINNSITSLKRTFAGLATKRGGYGDVTKSIGSLVSAQKHLAESVREVKSAVSDSIPVLRAYKKEIGGVARAHFAIARATGQVARNESRLWDQSTKSAKNYVNYANSVRGHKPIRVGGGGGPGGGTAPTRGWGGGTGGGAWSHQAIPSPAAAGAGIGAGAVEPAGL
jgi:hypothetical protein